MKLRSIFPALLLVVAACGGAAADSSSNALVYGTPEVTGSALPEFGDGVDTAVGSPIPIVVGQEFDGSSVMIDPANGQGKVILFLAHWCPHCQDEVPVVVDWVNQNGIPDGVELIAVVTATQAGQANFPPADWLFREGWAAPVLVDDQPNSVANAFGLNAFPFFVMVAPDGTVVERSAGAIPVAEFERAMLSVVP